ncbi:MAG: Histidinol dehydrogenase HisD [Candidatus Methanohalarchaeum thermophilum]|uniref:Histidinol dehydrogenase n=1 Tax=Methanohalarchaeum thermophilum TaxID=1903181 RepID=A0A1Q6DXD0_METT1|nr:MAG: Histidinol dehydrogenase HisD [Candidatus Methanohalarchaeum thermophilum]
MEKIDLSQLDYDEIKDISKKQMEDVFDKKQAARPILNEINERGDKALIKYTKKFDGVELESDNIKVSDKRIKNSYENLSEREIQALEQARDNIIDYHETQLPKKIELDEFEEGITLGSLFNPLEKIGAYVPGGKASYPSSALMTLLPAYVAGVNEKIICTPPSKDGRINDMTLAAADIAGADKVFRVGGVQAIGAMAYGTKTIDKVQKIVGPGNSYVTAAKMLVRGKVEIEFPAGPSELVILADSSCDPGYVASDLLAQAEHGPDSLVILLTTSSEVLDSVKEEIKERTNSLNRSEIIKNSLKRAKLVLGEQEELINLLNDVAPEHLELMIQNPMSILNEIKNAGAIFVGNFSPTAVGDYATGCNHVLPTGGMAKIHSGLNVYDFMKRSSLQFLSKKGLRNLREITEIISEIEGLEAHSNSIKERFKEE